MFRYSGVVIKLDYRYMFISFKYLILKRREMQVICNRDLVNIEFKVFCVLFLFDY